MRRQAMDNLACVAQVNDLAVWLWIVIYGAYARPSGSERTLVKG
jgi:hypothetical protein